MRKLQEQEIKVISAGHADDCGEIGPFSDVSEKNEHAILCQKEALVAFLSIAIPVIVICGGILSLALCTCKCECWHNMQCDLH